MAVDEIERNRIRDIILTHSHLDHIAGLPLFIDDQFAYLEEPIRIHAAQNVIDVLERDIFNWSVYPKFSDLTNDHGHVVEYIPFQKNVEFKVGPLSVTPRPVNHKVPSSGFVISDGRSKIAITGDTAAMDDFWELDEGVCKLDALLIECAFPNELGKIAETSHHMTPSLLNEELKKFKSPECPIYVINIKPAYRERVIQQIMELSIPNLEVLEVGREYTW